MRNNRMPYQQVISDCNPGPKTHWMKRRMDQDRLDMQGRPVGKKLVTAFRSDHKCNPAYWDEDKRTWTEAGLVYVTRLSNYTGLMRKRFYEGEWSSAEGIVYPEFDPSVHVISRTTMPIIPPHWPRYLVIDFGYTNPFVALFAALDPVTKIVYIYREWAMTKMLVADHAKKLKQLCAGEPPFTKVICDHDAEGRATLEAITGWITYPAKKEIETNIQEVKDRLTLDKNGYPGVYFFEDILVQRDEEFGNTGNAVGIFEEFLAYCYKENNTRVNNKEEPIDKNNHSLDSLNYLMRELSNHYGEWKEFRQLPPRPESIVTAQDPVAKANPGWFPFPKLGINVPDHRLR
jgi:phage terminase large subunit